MAAAGRGAARGSENAGRATAWIGRPAAGGAGGGVVVAAGIEAGGAVDGSALPSAGAATFFAAAAKEKVNFEAGCGARLDPVVGEETGLAAV